MKVVLWIIPVITLLTYTVECVDNVPSNSEAYFAASSTSGRGLAKGKKGDKRRRGKKGSFKKSNKSSKSKKDDNGLPVALVKKKEDGMVTTSHPLATQAGLKILKKGGTAADAMVAVQTVLGLVEPQSSGLGGGAFAVYYDTDTNQVTTFDGREKAPAAATGDRFAATSGFVQAWQSGLSVGVPGTPKLLERVHARYGHLEWASLFEPAIQLAEEGFPLDGATSSFVQRLLSFNGDCQDGSRFMFRDPVAFEYFVNSTDCTAKPAGTILTNEEYSATLRVIADSGAASFYTGTIAEDIAAAVTNDIAIPGDMTTDDLQNYEVVERDPVCVDYKDDYKVCGMGPPSSGALAVGQILGILANFDVVHSDDPLDVGNVHLFTQAMRLAFADRALYVADPDFVTVPVEGMLDHDYLTNRAQLIDLDQDTVATPGVPPDDFDPLGPDDTAKTTGTSHFSIVDRYGNAISMTTSIESPFGNGVMVHGFLLNNELTDFSFAPKTEDGQPIANRVEGNKRPRSSMAPTIVLRRGKAKMLTGSPGGSRIIGYTAKSVWNILEFGYDAQEAINVPHYQNRNAGTELEDSIPGITLDYNATALAEHLTMMGHDVTIEGAGVLRSGLGIIQIDGRKLIGGADQRRDGAVA